MKRFLLLFLASFICMIAYAEEEVLKVQMKDGRSILLLLEDKPIIVLEGEQVIIKAGDQQYECSIDELATTVFETKSISSLEQLSRNEILLQRTSDGLIVSNLGAEEPVFVYSSSGQLISSVKADNEGTAKVHLLESGFYIIKFIHETIKIKI